MALRKVKANDFPCEINPETNVPIPTIETVIVMPDGTTVPFDERLF